MNSAATRRFLRGATKLKVRALVLLILLPLLVSGWADFGTAQIARSQPSPVYMLHSSAPDSPDSDLQAIVDSVVKDLPGTWGVAIKKLDTGQYAEYNGDTPQVSASLYKLWVLEELFHQIKNGVLTLDDFETVTGDDAYYDSSLNELRFGVGYEISVRQAAE